MEIIVYTKSGCGLCESFKAKLRDHLKVTFDERDLDATMVLSDTWQDDKIAKFTSVWTWMGRPVPFIAIDKHGYDYIRALKEIKRRLEAGEAATLPEPERDKTLDKLGPAFTEKGFVSAVWRLCGNHVDYLHVKSLVERTYDNGEAVMARREVMANVSARLLYRDPSTKPMTLIDIIITGDSFRGALHELSVRLGGYRKVGCIVAEEKGASDEHAGTEGQEGGDRGEAERPDSA